jgi:hypothetical protein
MSQKTSFFIVTAVKTSNLIYGLNRAQKEVIVPYRTILVPPECQMPLW